MLLFDERVDVVVGRDEPVLRPLDLAGELTTRKESVRRWQRVRKRCDEPRLVVEHLGQPRSAGLFPEPPELVQRRGVEGAGLDPLDTELGEPLAELARGLLRERDRQDLARLESAARDLPGDAPRDGGGLTRAGAREDGDRPSGGLGSLTLGRVQAVEDRGGVGHRREASSGLRQARKGAGYSVPAFSLSICASSSASGRNSACSAGPIGTPFSIRPASRSRLRCARSSRRGWPGASLFAVASRRARLAKEKRTQPGDAR